MSQAEMRVEQGQFRIRALLGGAPVLDTTHPLLVWEKPYYPQYYIPREDVLAELFPTGEARADDQLGVAVTYDVVSTAGKAEGGAWQYPSGAESLRGLVRFDWDSMDSWFAEDEEIFTHPRDPYTRVDILPSSRTVRVELDGVVIAESRKALLLAETGLPMRWYLPKTDVRMDALRPTDKSTHCPYKGQAEYWTISVGGPELRDAVWSYRTPLPESERIAGHLSFWPERSERLAVFVAGVAI